jgi:hypothetical protein
MARWKKKTRVVSKFVHGTNAEKMMKTIEKMLEKRMMEKRQRYGRDGSSGGSFQGLWGIGVLLTG